MRARFAPIAQFKQTDGTRRAEVCGTAIETPMDVTVRLSVLTKLDLFAPHFLTTMPFAGASEQYYVTTGVGPDLREAARSATRAMIGHLVAAHGLSREDVYMLCSVAGDLRIHEIVNMPNYVVRLAFCVSYLLNRCRRLVFWRCSSRSSG